MVENFSELKEQIKQLWDNLDKNAKIIIVTTMLVTIIGVLVLVNWASKPDYAVLFNNLSTKDAGSIVNQLKERQISYKIKENGEAIVVPKKEVYQLRLELASEGLPSGGATGFEIFDRNQIGSTDFEQKVNYYRALSGELSRTIKQLNSVKYAKAQITPSKNSIYKDKEQPAKASVLLVLKEYSDISKDKVISIANLVASSVNGLTPDKVTIVDSSGNLLSAMLEEKNDNSKFSYNQLELKEKVEIGIKKDLNVMLTKVLGSSNFVVTVNADLNFDQRNRETKEYKPVVDDQGIVRSQQIKEERSEGRTTTPSGVPGTTSNLPQYKIDNEDQEEYENTEKVTNYEINETIEKYIKAPGSIQRVSVSVSVNTADEELDNEKKEAITAIVSTAAGYDVKRGDRISVIGYPFDNSLAIQAKQLQEEAAAQRQKLLLFLIGAVSILIITIFILLRRSNEDDESEVNIESGESVDYVVDDAEEEFAASVELSDEERERQELQRSLRGIIEEQPEEITELIRSWLVEE